MNLNPAKVVEAIKAILPQEWTGWHEVNGARTQEVVSIAPQIGINWDNPTQPVEWLKFVASDSTGTHRLMGKMRLLEAGQQGGQDEIALDGIAVSDDDVVYGLGGKLLAFPPAVKLTVAYKYKVGDVHHRWEFAGPLRIPIGELIHL